MNIPITRWDGKQVGLVVGDTYITNDKLPKDFMRKFGGFGLSVDIQNKLAGLGVKWIVSKYRGVNVINYRFALKEYLESSLKHIFVFNGYEDYQTFVVARGHEMGELLNV